MTENKWTFAGMYNGEGVYYNPETKAIAIEKDHQYLVEPSPEEKVGIYKILSHLKSGEGNHDTF